LTLAHLQLTRTNQTTPPLDLRADYDVGIDRNKNVVELRTFAVKGSQKGNPLLQAELTSPMTVALSSTTSNAVGDSALNFSVSHLDLADWKPFLGDIAPAGDVNAKLQLLSQAGGKKLTIDLNSEINNLTAGSGTNQLTQATVSLSMRCLATDLKQFDLPQYKFTVARLNQPLMTVSGKGFCDQGAGKADLQLDAQILLARLLQAFPVPNMNISSGTADLQAHLVQKDKAQTLTGNFTMTDFTGKLGDNQFRSFGT